MAFAHSPWKHGIRWKGGGQHGRKNAPAPRFDVLWRHAADCGKLGTSAGADGVSGLYLRGNGCCGTGANAADHDYRGILCHFGLRRCTDRCDLSHCAGGGDGSSIGRPVCGAMLRTLWGRTEPFRGRCAAASVGQAGGVVGGGSQRRSSAADLWRISSGNRGMVGTGWILHGGRQDHGTGGTGIF